MYISQTVVYFFPLVVGVFGNYFNLSALIERIHQESDSTSVYFIGMDSGFLSEFMRNHADIPVAILTSPSSDKHEDFFQNSGIIVTQTGSDTNHTLYNDLIRGLKVRKFVIISASDLDSLKQSFSYFWENKFTRIFGIAENTSYAYLPYADNPVQELHTFDAIPHSLKDLNGYTFRTAVRPEFPRIFWYSDKHNRRQIGGSFGGVFQNFVQTHNATFKDTLCNDSVEVYMLQMKKSIKEGKIDISTSGFPKHSDYLTSYPVKMSDVLILVPLNGYVNPNEYFLRPFTPAAWACIGLTLVYIVLMDVVMDICMESFVDVWHSFSRAYMIMIGTSTERPIRSAYRFHGQVLVFAFILGNFYVIYFTSFLTVFIKVKQYDTIQDLVDNNVRVMFPDVFWKQIAEPGRHPVGFERIVKLIDYPTFVRAKNDRNITGFAYPLYKDTANFLINMLTYLKKPTFHITSDGVSTAYMGFLLTEHSPFKEILDNFIFRIMESGLVDKWEFDSVALAPKTGYEHYGDPTVDLEHVALNLEHLRFAWTCLVIGWTFALIVFLAELFGSTARLVFILSRNYLLGRSSEGHFGYVP